MSNEKLKMGGTLDVPAFAEAEVSGAQTNGDGGIKAAGNKEPQYLLNPDGTYQEDENGNKIENPNYNPNGFQIIADQSNTNIYKLYNNGNLYGKGIKGKLLNTSLEEMKKIENNKWKEFTIPSDIPGDNSNRKILPGYDSMFIIDQNEELWAWGINKNNKFGLDKENQIEYTEAKATKLNVNNKTVKKVFSLSDNTFVITTDNELYAAGLNLNGQLGIGASSNNKDFFSKVEFTNPQNILTVTQNSQYQNCVMILTSEGKIYYAGYTNNNSFNDVKDASNNCCKFVEVYNGTRGNGM